MKRTVFCSALLIIALGLVASGAVADECKQIFARYNIGAIYFDCTYNGFEYEYCVDAPVQGNLRGTWHTYGAPAWNAWETLTVPDDALGIDGWENWAFWNLSVIETKHGELLMQGNDFVNLDAYFTYGAYSSVFSVIDGTGNFEGATGWLGGVGDEVTGKGIFWGEVCTP